MKLILNEVWKEEAAACFLSVTVPVVMPSMERKSPLRLPQVSENDISRHYTQLANATHGVNDGAYPLGSCTMKYNPKVNDEAASLPGFYPSPSAAAGGDSAGIPASLHDAEKISLRDHGNGCHDIPARSRRSW